jgi:hypothetical protein
MEVIVGCKPEENKVFLVGIEPRLLPNLLDAEPWWWIGHGFIELRSYSVEHLLLREWAFSLVEK